MAPTTPSGGSGRCPKDLQGVAPLDLLLGLRPALAGGREKVQLLLFPRERVIRVPPSRGERLYFRPKSGAKISTARYGPLTALPLHCTPSFGGADTDPYAAVAGSLVAGYLSSNMASSSASAFLKP